MYKVELVLAPNTVLTVITFNKFATECHICAMVGPILQTAESQLNTYDCVTFTTAAEH